MQVTVKLGYNTFAVDVSGAELEVFNRVISKMIPFDRQYLGGEYRNVRMPDTTLDFEVTVQRKPVDLFDAAEAKLIQAADKRAARAALMQAIGDAIRAGTNPEKQVDDLKTQLYYDDVYRNPDRVVADSDDISTDIVTFYDPASMMRYSVDCFGDVHTQG